MTICSPFCSRTSVDFLVFDRIGGRIGGRISCAIDVTHIKTYGVKFPVTLVVGVVSVEVEFVIVVLTALVWMKQLVKLFDTMSHMHTSSKYYVTLMHAF
jgi:hypothetical protein